MSRHVICSGSPASLPTWKITCIWVNCDSACRRKWQQCKFEDFFPHIQMGIIYTELLISVLLASWVNNVTVLLSSDLLSRKELTAETLACPSFLSNCKSSIQSKVHDPLWVFPSFPQKVAALCVWEGVCCVGAWSMWNLAFCLTSNLTGMKSLNLHPN